MFLVENAQNRKMFDMQIGEMAKNIAEEFCINVGISQAGMLKINRFPLVVFFRKKFSRAERITFLLYSVSLRGRANGYTG